MARLINPTLVILIIRRHSLHAATSSTPLHLTKGETWAWMVPVDEDGCDRLINLSDHHFSAIIPSLDAAPRYSRRGLIDFCRVSNNIADFEFKYKIVE